MKELNFCKNIFYFLRYFGFVYNDLEIIVFYATLQVLHILTRPNGSTRSKDYTQMTTIFNPNEHNDFI